MNIPVSFHPEFFVALVELGYSWDTAQDAGSFLKLGVDLGNLVGACLLAVDGRPNGCGIKNVRRARTAGWIISSTANTLILPSNFELRQ